GLVAPPPDRRGWKPPQRGLRRTTRAGRRCRLHSSLCPPGNFAGGRALDLWADLLPKDLDRFVCGLFESSAREASAGLASICRSELDHVGVLDRLVAIGSDVGAARANHEPGARLGSA